MQRLQPCMSQCSRGISALVGRTGTAGVGGGHSWRFFGETQGTGASKGSRWARGASLSPPGRRHTLALTLMPAPADARTALARLSSSDATHATHATTHENKSNKSNKRVVFLGTPEVASKVLTELFAASRASQSGAASGTDPWEISAVVTQPGRPKGRGKVPQPSPVYETAISNGIPESRIFTPVKASEKDFLAALADLNPDICITAAYGNYLPTAFLSIPTHGTLNIHPSLLPLYRGAAPVQRSLQDGVRTSGVTVLYTVKEMDAGPIVDQATYDVGENVTSPELLDALFRLGTERLVACLPGVWDGRVSIGMSREQAHGEATHAGKIGREEGRLQFRRAEMDHDKTRAFCGWPGTYGRFLMVGEDGKEEMVEVKVLETRVGESGVGKDVEEGLEARRVVLDKGKNAMVARCADGSVLELRRLQNPGKKPVDGKAFGNGLGGRKMYWIGDGEE